MASPHVKCTLSALRNHSDDLVYVPYVKCYHDFISPETKDKSKCLFLLFLSSQRSQIGVL